ncbi:dipeptidyl aminopeptidase/acylaminoacyl peptidase [Microbacterium terrae]|uniref:Esterase n=1 Tax=Microbacterium terrae TaxID=69369 RepID=A0A0M2GZ40_9MICO|nr:prolyl oligopeptidase family serine peptidase [Microbacterium terrae]KJL39128.1 esterase [Microbacterium terrae]MBP1077717.1 dipeptidyl aminopeptidase/acylaminoacyl peptidase [Microbacterium terrae]GLJ99885.1 acyl-peptide hydrolase [Microbacterium terrae]
MSRALPYGSWPSPLSAAAVAAAAPRIEGARFVGDEIWWGETVPGEGGRTAVRRRRSDGSVADVLPDPWNARSRVHEYGGGAWTATDDGVLLFVEKADQRVWALRPGEEPRALTPADGMSRFGGLVFAEGLLVAVRERHDGSPVPPRDIVTIALDGSLVVTDLVGDSDFLAQPALSPGATHLAWVAWNHPAMPWDRAEVRVGRLAENTVAEWTTVAGGTTAGLQPEWLGPDDLAYLDDPTGRWNLRRVHLSASLDHSPVVEADADTGGPLWSLGVRWYAPLDDGRFVAVQTNGADRIVVIDPSAGTERDLALPITAGAAIESVRGTRVLISGAGSTVPAGLWEVDVDAPDRAAVVRGGETQWDEGWMPRPRAVSVDGPNGPVHAFVYPPTNPDVAAPGDEQPPYLVLVHGGPTSHVAGAVSPKIAYFTSRGIGVLDVNYGGSSGYGRAYRERLLGTWGVVDVEDTVAAASGLAAAGIADPARLAIAGGSAGGWTVLCTLAASDLFAAGISRYGVADLRRLAADTHDFEARYLDGLVGPLPAAEDVYIARSPLSHLDRMTTPMLIEQGLEDEVVPPSQSEAVRDALRSNGVAHAYLAFEGEGHGFRRAETVTRQLEAEVAFLGRVLGFEPDGLAPIALD